MKRTQHILPFCLLLLLFAACNPLRKLPAGHFLLNKNIISISDTVEVEREELYSLLKQKPNRKILWVLRFHQGLYNIGNAGDTTVANHKGIGKIFGGLKRGLRTIGEPPVLLDSFLTEKSRQQIELYLQKKGYFNASVKDSISVSRKNIFSSLFHRNRKGENDSLQVSKSRKAEVYYNVNSGSPYKIRSFQYSSEDVNMSNILAYEKDFSIIKKGSNYDEDILGKERERIAANMRDRGYYLFNKNYITYDPDSSLNSNQVDVYLYLNRINENVEQSGNELPVENHQRYHLNKIYIQLDYDPKNPFSSKLNDAVPYKDYFFVYDSTSEYIKKDAILNCLFIKTGDRFYQHDIDYTNVRLNELGVFKFINFQFKPVARDTTKTEYLLNVYIQLSPNARQEYKTETEATNTGSNLGLAASFGYRNKNIFRGAEVLEFKISAAFEALRNLNDINVSRKLLFFNSVEVGPEINLTFKKFLIPEFIRKGFSRRFNPKTTISTGFNYQTRPEYTRRILKFAFGFQWIGSATQRFYWYPFEINSVQVDLSTEFQDKIIANYDNNLINSYSDHLITDGRFTWIYNNQKAAYKNFQNVRVNFETSGFSLRLLNNSAFAKLDTVNESYSLFGIRYSQYAKIDIDATYHQYINQNNVMVYRFAGGFGLTTGNSKKYLLPFEKTFFSGGANGIRAWQARSLGPGSYKDEIKIDQAGDIKLEVNIEYRSSILKILEGAVFADAGNVWIRGDRADAWEGSKFVIGEFVNQVALGAGIGVRFNFSFFIIRLDAAVKLRDPARELPYRWVYAHQKLNLADVLFNLAIGYPF